MIAALLLAQYAGTLDLIDTTRISARATQPPLVIASPHEEVIVAMDLATSASLRLGLRDHSWDYTLTYTPTVTAADVELGLEPQLIQAASASVAWHDRFWRVAITEAGSYGLLNSGFLYSSPASTLQTQPAQAAPPAAMGTTGPTPEPMPGMGGTAPSTPVQPVPQPQTISFGSSSSLANVTFRASRLTTLTLLGGFTFAGGLDTYARQYLPLQQSANAALSLGYLLSRTDRFTLATTAQSTVTQGECAPGLGPPTAPGAAAPFCTEHVPSAQMQGTFTHTLSHTSSLSIGGGVAAFVAQEPGVDELVIVPTVTLSYSQSLAALGSSRLLVTAGVAPTVDLLTGLPSTRVQMGASASKLVSQGFTVSGSLSAVQSIPVPVSDPYPVTIFVGGLTAAWRVDRQVDLTAGVNELWQNESGYPTITSTVAFLGVTTRLPQVRF